jgi:hypothetical protein
MTGATVRTFLPWYRRGLPTGITQQSVRTAGRVQVPLTVTQTDRAESAAVPLQLHGPGEVTGLDQREVRRVHPYAGCTTFEPGLFAHIELREPDLPWRFTPLAPDDRNHLQPWLALIVADDETAVLGAAAPGALPPLSCPTADLPDLGDAWAWAHLQVTRTVDEDIEEVVRDTPQRAVARLLCPRQLLPEHAYLACLVPTFEAGRMAGLGDDPGAAADALAPAWGAMDQAELPVYFHWRFSTAEPGSYETLVQALEPHTISEEAATRTIDVHDPGWGIRELAPTESQALLRMQGPLRPVRADDLPPPQDAQLIKEIRAAVDQADERPQIRPPLYGQDYADRRTAPEAGEEPAWLRDLNLDPRHRLAAGLGDLAVRLLQDDLVADAWSQLARAGGAPEEQGRRQLADALLGAVTSRAPPALDSDTFASSGSAPTMVRLMRSGGPLARRSSRLAGDPDRTASVTVEPLPSTRQAPPGRPAQTGFTPRFDRPAYDLLNAVAPEWVLPGLADVPPNSVSLVETNAAFVEAFLLGLNHGLAHELSWRRFPVDRMGTYFGRFWPALDGSASTDTDIRGWTAGALGAHIGQPGALVLLVRGELLRRYPETEVYALRSTPAGGPGDDPILPIFSGRWGDDVSFVGFPLTEEEAFADGSDLWFVIEEAAHRARFGCDEATKSAPELPKVWQGLQWGNADFEERTHLPADGPLAGRTLAVTETTDDPPEQATWGLDAAHMAVITQQPPLRAVLPARRWRPPRPRPGPDP